MTETVPIHLIAGFLGSGKTTLLRNFLTLQPADESLAVFVNEFGEMGIDGDILKGFESEVFEITGGCICCTLKVDFITSLFEVMEKFGPDRIIVEASGIAVPEYFSDAVSMVADKADVSIASIVTIVDAEFLPNLDIMGNLYIDQIRSADLLILNKIDLIGRDEVEPSIRKLFELNPRARIIPVVHSAVEREIVLNPINEVGLRGSVPGEVSDIGTGREMMTEKSREVGASHESHDTISDEHKGDHEHDTTQGFVAFSFPPNPGADKDECIIDPDLLKEFLSSLPWEVIRIKGFVRMPEGNHFLNYTYRRPELIKTDDEGPNRLAFVGWKIDPETILSGIRGCVIKD